MLFGKILIIFLYKTVLISATPLNGTEVLVLISSQDTPQHRQRSHELRQELLLQIDTIPQDYVINVQIMHEIFNYPGDWTILAALPHLLGETRLLNDNTKWIILCQDNTHISLLRLLDRLAQKSYNSEALSFWGYPLYDRDSTIIHHFAFFKNPNWFPYPMLSAGVIFTGNLFRSLGKLVAANEESQILRHSEFSIDAAHELARFIYDNLTPSSTRVQRKVQNNSVDDVEKSYKIILKSAAFICASREMAPAMRKGNDGTETTENCLMYAKPAAGIETHLNVLGQHTALSCVPVTTPPTGSEHIYFAIKTCSKFHKERIPIIESTWAAYALQRKYFTDTADSSIDGVLAISTGIPNVEIGHCAKTLAILQLSLKDIQQMEHKRDTDKIRWLMLVDDDTLLSVSRLSDLLSCQDHTMDIYLGERYGYRLHAPDGFNYITGGGGIAMSLPFVRHILQHCSCPAPTAPDDMILGYCAQVLGIKPVHSSQFHQARPQDYASVLLQQHPLPISFHKFWQLDARSIYETWFGIADRTMWQRTKRSLKTQLSNVTHVRAPPIVDSMAPPPLPTMLRQANWKMYTGLENSKAEHLDL